ncbi:hypothetical protein CDAR_64391 [Caerostris darwini]|uniref:Secreted protein n=1 Tax=Caerostris darwini TaxID=1538125 RepID=A0AAV4VAQ7_9ARAC|nr:hypothetical protein CDAR_64391 [Caerostris darwini]
MQKHILVFLLKCLSTAARSFCWSKTPCGFFNHVVWLHDFISVDKNGRQRGREPKSQLSSVMESPRKWQFDNFFNALKLPHQSSQSVEVLLTRWA